MLDASFTVVMEINLTAVVIDPGLQNEQRPDQQIENIAKKLIHMLPTLSSPFGDSICLFHPELPVLVEIYCLAILPHSLI